MIFEQAITEGKGEEKRKETWEKNHPGYNWNKDVEPTVKKMKKHPELSKGKTKDGKKKSPYALRQWQLFQKNK